MDITKHIEDDFVDQRGAIKKILDNGKEFTSALLITSKAGAVRANHYHKKDTHYVYILSGKMEYFERPADGGETVSAVLEAGDMVFTPPGVAHAMKFLEDSQFLAFSTEPRNQNAYESDTVPVKLIES